MTQRRHSGLGVKKAIYSLNSASCCLSQLGRPFDSFHTEPDSGGIGERLLNLLNQFGIHLSALLNLDHDLVLTYGPFANLEAMHC